MSIWSTQWDTDIPARTQYGQPATGDESLIHNVIEQSSLYVCTSGMSSVLRLSVDEGERSGMAYLSPDEARQLAGALMSAAEATETANLVP